MSRRLIVSVDGGGIRGIIPLVILKEIQKKLSFDFYDLPTSWWGTSTGALITGALNIDSGRSFSEMVQSILDMYEFRSASTIHSQEIPNPTRGINQLIHSNFGTSEMEAFPNLNIVVSKEDTLTPVVFNSANSCNVADAIKASCAFPGLFPAVEINNMLYVDGYFNAKNPIELALSQEESLDENLVVLSLGTGILREVDAIEDGVKQMHHRMKKLANEKGFTYFRFNPKLINAVDSMQNTSPKNILNLRKDAQQFIVDKNSELERFVKAVSHF